MTLQFGVKSHVTHGLVEAVDHSPVNWWRDLAAYQALKKECDTAMDRQTRFMELIRTGVDPLPCHATRACSSTDAAKEELAMLDVRLHEMRAQMRQLETNLLTRDPETPSEVSALLRFVSDMLFAGASLDTDYLADLLESCADGMAAPDMPVQPLRN